MKTLFYSMAICLMVIALTVSCSAIGGPRIKEVRNVSEFSSIEVSAGLEVVLRQSDSTEVIVEASEDFMSSIETHTKGQTLIVTAKPKPKLFGMGVRHATVYITTPTIEKLSVGSGCDVNILDSLKSQALQMSVASGSRLEGKICAERYNLSLSSGSSLELFGKFNHAAISVASGSSLELKGAAGDINIDMSSGSKIDAFDFTVKNLVCKVSSGSSLEMTVSETLDVTGSSGSSIEYKGDGKIINSNISIGARLSKVR